MKGIKIISNTIGKLNKIKEGSVFTSNDGFVLEFLQNSSRAKATRVDVEIDFSNSVVTFYDNGVGCSKPESVFTLDSSSWESTSDGFGIGFWSMLAYPIKSAVVSSKSWTAKLDVEKIFSMGNLDVEVEKHKSMGKGFKVKMYCEEHADLIALESCIKEHSATQMYDVYINGVPVEKIDIFEQVRDETDYNVYVRNKLFEGVLGVSDTSKLKIYYEGRFVCKEYVGSGVFGVLHMKKGALTYKEPDRRAVIYDDKYYAFERKVDSLVRDLYKSSLKCMDFEDMDRYSRGILNNIDSKLYKKILKISEDMILNAAVTGTAKKKKRKVQNADIIDDSDEDCVTAESGMVEADNDTGREVAVSSDIFGVSDVVNVEAVRMADKTVVNTRVAGQSKDVVDVSREPELLSVSEFNFKSIKKALWVSSDSAYNYNDDIASARYAGFTIFKAPNELYEKLYEDYNIPHISRLNDICKETSILKDVRVRNKKELRMLELLEPIRKHFGLPEGVFKIANIESKIEYVYRGSVLGRELKRNTTEEFNVLGCAYNGSIYLDRTFLNNRKFRFSGIKRLATDEFRYLMYVIPIVSHELAHHLYDTNDETMAQYKYQESIQKEILNIYIN